MIFLLLSSFSDCFSCYLLYHTRQDILRRVTSSFLCEQYSEQIALFLLPAMAYGKYPFPFVELIQSLIQDVAVTGTHPSTDVEMASSSALFLPDISAADSARSGYQDSPWLLASVLTLANKELGKQAHIFTKPFCFPMWFHLCKKCNGNHHLLQFFVCTFLYKMWWKPVRFAALVLVLDQKP